MKLMPSVYPYTPQYHTQPPTAPQAPLGVGESGIAIAARLQANAAQSCPRHAAQAHGAEHDGPVRPAHRCTGNSTTFATPAKEPTNERISRNQNKQRPKTKETSTMCYDSRGCQWQHPHGMIQARKVSVTHLLLLPGPRRFFRSVHLRGAPVQRTQLRHRQLTAGALHTHTHRWTNTHIHSQLLHAQATRITRYVLAAFHQKPSNTPETRKRPDIIVWIQGEIPLGESPR